jgi:hypothetical protein
LADHWRESYVGETGKSTNAAWFAARKRDDWRNIVIEALMDLWPAILNGRFYGLVNRGFTLPSLSLTKSTLGVED